MSCTDIQPALSELVDGTLGREARAAVEEHLASCPDCRALVADLRRLRASARALPKMAPPEAIWQKVRAEFEAESGRAKKLPLASATAPAAPLPSTAQPADAAAADDSQPTRVLRFMPRRRHILTGLAAAAVIVVAVSAGLFFVNRAVQAPVATPNQAAAHPEPAQTVQSIESELDLANQHYDKAITALEQMAKDGQASLDPQVAGVLQKNMGVIDQAIAESRAAIKSQPTSEVAQASLFEALQRKVGLLRDTIALINEMRKGDQAGAAKIVGGLGKS